MRHIYCIFITVFDNCVVLYRCHLAYSINACTYCRHLVISNKNNNILYKSVIKLHNKEKLCGATITGNPLTVYCTTF